MAVTPSRRAPARSPGSAASKTSGKTSGKTPGKTSGKTPGKAPRKTSAPRKRAGAKQPASPGSASQAGTASQRIDERIAELGDWRGALLGRLRALVRTADPEVVEEWKWRGVPVWSHDGILCTGETYKTVVKMTFAHGAVLDDPSGLFNASLEGNTRRAIDFHEGENIDEPAVMALVRSAVMRNRARAKR